MNSHESLEKGKNCKTTKDTFTAHCTDLYNVLKEDTTPQRTFEKSLNIQELYKEYIKSDLNLNKTKKKNLCSQFVPLKNGIHLNNLLLYFQRKKKT